MAEGASTPLRVYLELGKHRVFACAPDWPGWCRSGKTEAQALEGLAAAAPRYAVLANEAGLPFSRIPGAFDVVERVVGSATTDFGAPDKAATSDGEPLNPGEAERLAALVAASWKIFDQVVAGAPAELRKGPRGGGRDRDAIVAHILGAEVAYAQKLGIRQHQPEIGESEASSQLRAAILHVLRTATDPGPLVDKGWPIRYAARRIAWHVLDHAWEIEDRAT